MIKTITQPGTGYQFRMGRTRPAEHAPRLRMGRYKSVALPAPPATLDYARSAGAIDALSQMYLNNVLGDCVPAGCQHIEGLLVANTGARPPIFSNAETESNYHGMSGGAYPGVDGGCDEATALDWWQKNGLAGGGSPIAGRLSVDATNRTEVMQALWLFENLIFGVELPQLWIDPMPSASGFTWDVAGAPDPDNGHCFIGCGYDQNDVKIATWGMTGWLSFAAVAEYASTPGQGELYTVVSKDMVAKATQKAPNTFNWDQLLADFEAMR